MRNDHSFSWYTTCSLAIFCDLGIQKMEVFMEVTFTRGVIISWEFPQMTWHLRWKVWCFYVLKNKSSSEIPPKKGIFWSFNIYPFFLFPVCWISFFTSFRTQNSSLLGNLPLPNQRPGSGFQRLEWVPHQPTPGPYNFTPRGQAEIVFWSSSEAPM